MKAIKIGARASVGKRTQEVLEIIREGQAQVMMTAIGPKAVNQAVKISAEVLSHLREAGISCSLDARKDVIELSEERTAHRMLMIITAEGR